MAHIYNPSYSGGSDQEDPGLKPAWAVWERPYLKKPFTRKKKQNQKLWVFMLYIE
jgi:hypothetical protein